MKKNYYLLARTVFSSLGLLLGARAAAQAPQPLAAIFEDAPASSSPLRAALEQARPLTLDVAALRAALAVAPPEGQPGAAPLVLALPLPTGGTGRFAVWQTAVMAPALAARYPEIQTFAGRGLDETTATVRLDLTPAGFHAQVLSPATGTVYIEPSRRGDVRQYLSFFGRDVRPGAGAVMVCHQPPASGKSATGPLRANPGTGGGGPAAIGSGALLRTYRLAVAATGEYTQYYGGTVSQALAAIATSVNRVNGVFETEAAVRFVLVANNNLLIYTNPVTDPYTDGDSMAMLPENQTTIDNVIGTANYDIGHVFGGQNAGGRGAYSSACQAATKAQGATALSSPVGDFFSVKYVCHELGHQFGAHHIFNSNAAVNCSPNRTAGTAWEPGSGSTIMSYSGLCPGQDIQSDSDPYFNLGSYEEMRAFIVTTTCATTAGTSNTPPAVSGPPSGRTLPIATPFRLTATGADAEGDPLLYSWQQLDLGSAGGPTDPQVANDNIPLFRALPPSTTPTRYFPQLSDVVSNVPTVGERLPTVARQLTFKCVAKDRHQGPLGTIGGVTTSDSVKLRVTGAAGPFVVTSPNTALTWTGGAAYNVTWNVAGTTANGVNCALVDVRLSTDGGYTYPTALALSVPNSGTAAVTLPSVATSQARIMVAAADNYFFDISNTNFTISSPSVCAPPTAVAVSNVTNTGARVSFTPGGGVSQYVVTTVPATTPQTVVASPLTLTGLLPGTAYTVYVASVCGSGTSVAVGASFVTTAPPVCGVPSDLAITNRTMTGGRISFVGSASATSYTITTQPATTTQTVTASPAVLTGLTPGTVYVVQVVSNCAGGATSTGSSLRFRTVAPVPTNDLCAAAIPLACGQRVLGSTESATAIGDPTTFCDESVDGGGVFYTIVGTGGRITLTNCDQVTDYDTKLFVYRGACGGPYTCVAGNDDTNANGCAQPSTVTFNSALGVPYLVFVSGYGGEKGSFALLATCGTVSATASAAAATFQVWPNPAGAQAAFRVTLAAPAPAATTTLCNVLGQRVAQRAFTGAATELPTTGLAAGTYLLSVQVAGQAPAVRRVVVE